MKKIFSLIGISAIGMSVFAEGVSEPIHLEDAFVNVISPNGQYAVSQNMYGIKIFNLSSGQVDEYMGDMEIPSIGLGQCVSNNGIVLGSLDETTAQYWKDGEWYDLQVPASSYMCLSNAITPDGSRICGSVSASELSLNGDALMQVPVIWNANGDGYGAPVMLPHPELDFTGRVPQYITATDISADGKTIIGQIMNATGMISYPIIYTENSEGKWSYKVVNEESFVPAGKEFPTYPGDSPERPNELSYMTAEEEAAYNAAYQAWIDSWYQGEYPNIRDYMSAEELAEFEADYAVYMEQYLVWEEAYDAWFGMFYECIDRVPMFWFNSMKISPDAKTFGGTVEVPDPEDFWNSSIQAYVGDVATEEYTVYNQTGDMNLTYLGNNGVALASTSIYTVSNSYVLENGRCSNMYYWMTKQCLDYGVWMKDNMTFEMEAYDWDTGEFTTDEMLMTGRAVGTPDLDIVALTVQNVWDYMTEGECFIFNVKEGQASNVTGLAVPNNGCTEIYDLTGRKLNEVAAPGIYIINGEKKVVR